MNYSDPEYIFEYEGQKLPFTYPSFGTEKAFQVYLEGKSKDVILRSKLPANLLKEQMNEWRHDCTVGYYGWLGETCMKSLDSLECIEELAFLIFNQKKQINDRSWFHDFCWSKSKVPLIVGDEQVPQTVLREIRDVLFDFLSRPNFTRGIQQPQPTQNA